MIQYHLCSGRKFNISVLGGLKNTLRIHNILRDNDTYEVENIHSVSYSVALSGGLKETFLLSRNIKLAASQLGNIYLGDMIGLSGMDFKLGL
ncbi:MAG: hypothetical protein LH473_10905 [Chitinophagales bacterium]|nr:hypothetical protein [Chitinophagales bacterium]